MITSNFKKLLTVMFSSMYNGNYNPTIPYNKTLPTLVSTDGTERTMLFSGESTARTGMYILINMMNYMSTSGSNDTLYLKVGTGTTAATEDDCELETVNTDVSCDTVVVGNSSNYTKTYTATFSNPTSSDIIVTEVGLYGKFVYYNYGTLTYTDCLLDRTVLTTPITIPAGESKAITYELGF